MHLPLTAHGDLNPLTQSVDDGQPNAMQATGHLVTTGSEFATGMQHRQNGFQGTFTGARMYIGGNTAAVVADGHRAVFAQHHQNAIAVASKCLVHRIVHHFINQVVQTTWPRGADVHSRALADRLKTLQDLNLFRAVGVLDLRGVAHSGSLGPGNRILNSRIGSEFRPGILKLPPAVYSCSLGPLKRYPTPSLPC